MSKLKALLIDHYDSFSYNIEEWMRPLFYTDVTLWDQLGDSNLPSSYDLLVFSPGPGNPMDYLSTMNVMKMWLGSKPILGICLGMQCYFAIKDLSCQQMNPPLHGKQTTVKSYPQESIIWKGLETPLRIAHYHSLMICLQQRDQKLCLMNESNEYVLSYENLQEKFIGVQFHPESFLTEQSSIMLTNLAEWVKNG